MIDAMAENLGATLTGFVAMTCLVIWPLFRGRNSILALQWGISTGFAAHYCFLHEWSAAMVCVLGSIQAIAAFFASSGAGSRWIGRFLIALMIVSGPLLWAGPETVLAIIAMVLVAFGRMELVELRMRAIILMGCTMWVVHDAYVGAYIALAADILSFVIGVVGLWPILVGWANTRVGVRAPLVA
jgi:hypothetical protein